MMISFSQVTNSSLRLRSIIMTVAIATITVIVIIVIVITAYVLLLQPLLERKD